ncbi:MAG TPA: PHB depolymerase family esterase [Candidatus Angelobacter sp.]
MKHNSTALRQPGPTIRQIRRAIATFTLLALFPTLALAQSLPNLALTRLNYTVTKRRVNPQGELKQKIDAVDKDLADAARLGKTAEVRRLLAKGLTLLAGKDWTDALDFSGSLVLRSDHLFMDSAKPATVRLEQIYSPSLQLEGPLSTRFSVCKPRIQTGIEGLGVPLQGCDVIKEVGKFDDVSRDLREAPFLAEVKLSGIADGPYLIQAEVLDGDRSLGFAALRVVLAKGLDDTLARIEAEAAHLPETLRADALYPVEHVRNINLGRVEMGSFDLGKELAGTEQLLAAAKGGKDPFAGRTGEIKRHYFFAAAGEIMPYNLYLPAGYTPARAFPLVVALHGLGANESSMLSPFYRIPPLADQHGFIVVAPLGYRVDGGYGAFLSGRRGQLSEQDVMEVIKLVRQQYKIDDSRIYLVGHSMGGIGTWALGAKYPEMWAALAPISGYGSPATVEKMKAIPEIVVHGDADDVVPVNGSRVMVAEMKKLGVDVKYIEVPGGSHVSVAGSNMAAIFDFFDAHRKGQGAAAGNAR